MATDTAPRSADVSARHRACAAAAYGLGGTMHSLPEEPLQQRVWRDLLVLVRQQRLTGLLTAAVVDGVWAVTDDQREELLDLHLDATCGVLQLEWALVRMVEQLRAAGVDARVLKGSAVAHLDYPRTHERLFGDVDLLVRGEHFDLAVATLSSLGYVRRFPQPRPGFDRRFSKGTSFITPEGFELDLHRTFVMGPFGLLVDLQDVWTGQDDFVVAGNTLQALSLEVRFMHACFHAALGDIVPRLVPQRDVAQLLLSDRLDLERVRALTERWHAEAVVARAVALAWETLAVADVLALSAWAQRYVPTTREQRYLSVYSDPRGSYAAKELVALGALPRLRDKAAFLHALVLPERSYLDGRHAGRAARTARALRAVTRGRGLPR